MLLSFTSAGRADNPVVQTRFTADPAPMVYTCAVPSTGGRLNWATKSCKVGGAAGTHDRYLRFTSGSGNLFNVDWWQFHR